MALKGDDVAEHCHAKSCWVIVHVRLLETFNPSMFTAPELTDLFSSQGKAYDVTDFLPEHPGGSKIILKYAVSSTNQL